MNKVAYTNETQYYDNRVIQQISLPDAFYTTSVEVDCGPHGFGCPGCEKAFEPGYSDLATYRAGDGSLEGSLISKYSLNMANFIPCEDKTRPAE